MEKISDSEYQKLVQLSRTHDTFGFGIISQFPSKERYTRAQFAAFYFTSARPDLFALRTFGSFPYLTTTVSELLLTFDRNPE